ncbi:hypothetical protein DC522_07125 [Microvirga sp. KLBC 81]|nr:hypothetical protein DC522_07125 [Microvirga sp. KLBC 81]
MRREAPLAFSTGQLGIGSIFRLHMSEGGLKVLRNLQKADGRNEPGHRDRNINRAQPVDLRPA